MSIKRWTVYVPVIHSEVYEDVEAETAEEAIQLVRDGKGHCVGEVVTGYEDEGFRAEEDS